MTVTLDKTHELKGGGYLLGVSGENESEQLVINIAYDVLLDKWAYIEFEQNGKPYTTERLTIANNQIVYVIPNGLLVQGDVFVQAVFRDASGFVWKSFKRKCLVTDEINACNNYPQTYPDFITEAQTLLDGITIHANKIDAVLSTEEARASAEAKRVENEATRQSNEAERVKNESERKNAETARASAENERQIAETARADAETARRTEFAGWADSIGSLNTYDKRLINLEEAGVGTLFDYQTDDVTAYSKTVPANALPYARLNKVGGMTYKVDNALTDTLVKSVGGYAIPEAIQLLDGYGIGINDTCYNYIDFERKVFVQDVASYTFTGNEEWVQASTQNTATSALYRYRTSVIADKVKTDFIGINNVLMSEFTNHETWLEKENSLDINSNISPNLIGDVFFFNSGIQTIEGVKEYMKGRTIVYVLQTPIETDISAYIEDNYIKVNGTIVFENDDAQAVPSEIVYAVKR